MTAKRTAVVLVAVMSIIPAAAVAQEPHPVTSIDMNRADDVMPYNSTTYCGNPLFAWTKSSLGAAPTHYEWRVQPASESAPTSGTRVDGTSVRPKGGASCTSGRLPDGAYMMWVRPMNAKGGGTFAGRGFRIDTVPPPAPTGLRNPGDASEGQDQTPNLKWNASPDASGIWTYDISIKGTAGSLSYQSSDTTLDDVDFKGQQLAPGIYTWTVRAIDNASQDGGWSAAASITIRPKAPDLLVTSLTSSAQKVDAGKSVNITTQIRNGGTADAGTFLVSWHTVTTPPGPNPRAGAMMDEVKVPSLGTGKTTSALTKTFTFVEPGDYYFFVRVDRLNAVEESNENNNYSEEFVKVTYIRSDEWDIAVASLKVSSEKASVGDELTVTYSIRNNSRSGDTPIPTLFPTTTSIRWSEDDSINTNDPEIGSALMSSLAASETKDGPPIKIKIPAYAVGGRTYYVGLIADRDDAIRPETETEGPNNVRAISIAVGSGGVPDLVPDPVSESGGAPQFVRMQMREGGGETTEPPVKQPIYMTVAIRNQGSVAATQPFDVALCVQPNGGGVCKRIATATVRHALKPGERLEVRFPSSASGISSPDNPVFPEAGSHTLKIVVDSANAVDERDKEGNNAQLVEMHVAGYGVTVITHGYTISVTGDLPFWVLQTGRAILGRATLGQLWRLDFNRDCLERLPTDNSYETDSAGEQVILVDWVAESAAARPGHAEAVGHAVFASLVGGAPDCTARESEWDAFLRPLGTVHTPVHFIGHSMGTVVNSEAIQRLSALWNSDYMVEQMTTLDPHDWINDDEALAVRDVDRAAAMPNVRIWANTTYADNYYNPSQSHQEFPHGRPIPGSQEGTGLAQDPSGLNLRAYEDFDARGSVFEPGPHSRVHTFYFGTIVPSITARDTEVDDEALRSSWYAYNKELDRGFAYSRLGGGVNRAPLGDGRRGHFVAATRLAGNANVPNADACRADPLREDDKSISSAVRLPANCRPVDESDDFHADPVPLAFFDGDFTVPQSGARRPGFHENPKTEAMGPRDAVVLNAFSFAPLQVITTLTSHLNYVPTGTRYLRVRVIASQIQSLTARFRDVNLVQNTSNTDPQAAYFDISSHSGRAGSIAVSYTGPGKAVISSIDFVTSATKRLTAAESSHVFGTVKLDASVSAPITLTNEGTSPIAVSAPRVTGPGASAFRAASTCGLSLNAGAKCVLTITFAPSASGEQAAAIVIESDADSDGTLTIDVSGSGAAAGVPAISVESSTRLSFGTIKLGGVSPPSAVSIRNVGSATLSGIQASLTSADFLKDTDTCTGGALAPGGSCGIVLRFKPTTVGESIATLSIASNDPDSPDNPYRVSLSGLGISTGAADIEVVPVSVSFGETRLQSTSIQTVRIRNTGDAALDVSAMTVVGANAAEFERESGCAVGALPAGDSCDMQLRFRPGSAGVRRAKLEIRSDDPDPDEAQTLVPLEGIGTTAPVASECLRVDGEGLTSGTPIPGWHVLLDPNAAGHTTVWAISNTLNASAVHSGGGAIRVNGDFYLGKELATACQGALRVDYWHRPEPGSSTNSAFALFGVGGPPDEFLGVRKNDQDRWFVNNRYVADYSGQYTHIVIDVDTSTGLHSVAIDGNPVVSNQPLEDPGRAAGGVRFISLHSGRGGVGTDSFVDDIVISGRPATTDPAPPPPTQLSVSSRSAWQPVGISVMTGDQVTITASGTIRFDTDGHSATPDGSGNPVALTGGSCTHLLCGAGFVQHALVGRIGSSTLADFSNGFHIGSSLTFVATATGPLMLGFNDGFVTADRGGLDIGGVGDNAGAFSVGVSVIRPTTLTPIMAVTPNPLPRFAVTKPGSRSEQVVTVANTGTLPLQISGTRLDGVNAGQFDLDTSACVASVPPNGQCSLKVGFAPSTEGPKSAQLLVFSNDTDVSRSPLRLDLTGTAAVRVPDSCLAIDGEDAGGGAQGWIVRLDGLVGSTAVSVETKAANPAVVYSGVAALRVNGDASVGKPLTSVCRGSVLLDFWYLPRPGASTSTVALYGTQGAVDRFVSVTKNDRDKWLVNGREVADYTKTYTHVVAVVDTDAGVVDVLLDGVLVAAGERIANDDRLTAGVRYVSLQSGMNGAGADSYFDDLLITGSAAAFAVLEPEITISGDGQFGGLPIGSSAAARSFLIRNDGTADLSVGSVAVASAGEFRLSLDGCTGATLSPGAACRVTVAYHPNRAGQHTGTLTIKSNDADETPVDLELSGTASTDGSPRLGVEIVQSLGTVAIGRSKKLVLRIANSGDGPLIVAGLSLAERTEEFASGGECDGLIVPPGRSCATTVEFKPAMPGLRTATFLLETNDPLTPSFQVELAGFGASAAVPDAVPDEPSKDLGVASVGGKASVQRIVITNQGSATLHINDVMIEGRDRADFRVESTTCRAADLQEAATCEVVIALMPASQGVKEASLLVDSSDPDKGDGIARVSLSAMATAQVASPPLSATASPRTVRFAAVRSANGQWRHSSRQVVNVTFSATAAWQAKPSVPWLTVTPSDGIGEARLEVTVDPSLWTDSLRGAIEISVADTTATVFSIPVSLQALESGRTATPFGSFDIPKGDEILSGSIAVSGWTLDDIGVARVEIWRDHLGAADNASPVASTPTDPRNGKVFVANATFVEGARPDVEALFDSTPSSNRAGWGYLLLTWGLPGQGNGAYTLHAYAFDLEGNVTTIGRKAIEVRNNAATLPFGSIDTPAIGGDAGTLPNFGWALTPGSACRIPSNGVQVSIDSGPLQPVIYGDARSDIAGAFPSFTNSAAAGGHFIFDWSILSPGVHAIGWYVTDDCNRADGIGSRFFNVGAGSLPQLSAVTRRHAASRVDSDAAITVARGHGELPAVLDPRAGSRTVEVKQGERIELRMPRGFDTAFQLGPDGGRRELPIGSTWDSASAAFYWEPGAGYLGRYRLVFTDGRERIQVRVVVVE